VKTVFSIWRSSISRYSERSLLAMTVVCLAARVIPAAGEELPSFAKPNEVLWLDQGWDATSADWFHHADQGTQTFQIPFEWFVALEQPGVSVGPLGLFADPAYLNRYGFISDDKSQYLPIGFAHGGPAVNSSGKRWTNPATAVPMTSIGLTCAACHTGRITYNGTEIRVEGAPANTNLKLLQGSLGLALIDTAALPLRRIRFENRVLGKNAPISARLRLIGQLNDVLGTFLHIKALEDHVASKSVEEGFGRLDALNRIGNQVFSIDTGLDANYAAESAPVHFPRIWDASWFLWVQYDGSIEQPMVRNAGEALGVAAPVTLSGDPNQLFRSAVRVDNLDHIETMLAGSVPPNAQTGFSGLRAPRWQDPKLHDVLPPINPTLAAQGQKLYASLCQGCHLAPVGTSEFWSSERWTKPNVAGQQYLDLELIPTAHVGTDQAQASGIANRQVSVPSALRIKERSFGPALGAMVENVVNKWYDGQNPPTPLAVRVKMNGYRPNGIQAPLAYKVRPLDGIWATAPYLHNGSVPTLYDLLSPVSERPKVFYSGNREFDPVKVGLKTDSAPGLTRFDTSIPGNLNIGHEFSDAPGSGVIGRLIEPDERKAIVEYLKTL
jgi:hypothetical protein